MIALKKAVSSQHVKSLLSHICIAAQGLLVCLCSAVTAQEAVTSSPAPLTELETNRVQAGLVHTEVPRAHDSQPVGQAQMALDEVPASHAHLMETASSAQEGIGDSPGVAAERGLVLRRGLRERDLSVGYGFKLNWHPFDGRTGVSFLTIIPRFGKFQTARREILFEFPFTVFTQPDTRYTIGATAIIRQHFKRRGRWVPFAELGSGFVLTNLRIKELSGSFQFSPQAGLGIRYSRRADSSPTIALRFYHLSNAGLRKPNVGLNTGLITVGYSRFF